MASAPIEYDRFDPKAIHFGEPRANKHNGKFVPLADASGAQRRFEIVTPVMPMPFGLNPYRDRKTPDGPVEFYYMEVSFRNMDTDPAVRTFYEKMKELDAHVLEVAEKNSVAWLGKKYTAEELTRFEVYKPIVQQNNPDYPPIMKTKAALRPDGKPYADFYDAELKEIDISEFEPRNCNVRLALRADSLWIVGKSIGLKWRVLQAQLVERPQRRGAYFSARAAPAEAEETDRELLGLEGADSDPELS